jgi:hypothetical protein
MNVRALDSGEGPSRLVRPSLGIVRWPLSRFSSFIGKATRWLGDGAVCFACLSSIAKETDGKRLPSNTISASLTMLLTAPIGTVDRFPAGSRSPRSNQLDKTEQCCGVCLPTLASEGSASCAKNHTSAASDGRKRAALTALTALTGFRRSSGTLAAPDRRPEFRHLTFRSTFYVPKCAPSTAAASSLALSPCCRKRVSEKKPWIVPG